MPVLINTELTDWLASAGFYREKHHTKSSDEMNTSPSNTPQIWSYKPQIWYIECCGRLLALTNPTSSKDHLDYISDHGPIEDITKGQLDFLLSKGNVKCIKDEFKNDCSLSNNNFSDCSFNMHEKESNISNFHLDINQDISKNKTYISDEMNALCNSDDIDQNHKTESTDTQEGSHLTPVTLNPQLVKLLATHLKMLYKINHDTDDNVIEKSLFRPSRAYHDINGAAYHEFCKAVSEYITNTKISTDKTETEIGKNLASMMWSVLQNQQYDNMPHFLPNLVGSWFLSETIRHHRSYISSLFIIDMLENKWEYEPDVNEHIYTWDNVLTHSMNDLILKRDDCYDLMIKYGGRHPMASRYTSHPADLKNRINQKEHSLLMHWLYKCLRVHYEGTEVKVIIIAAGNPKDKDKDKNVGNKWYPAKKNEKNVNPWGPTSKHTKERCKNNCKETHEKKWNLINGVITNLLRWRSSNLGSIYEFLKNTTEKELSVIHIDPTQPHESTCDAVKPKAAATLGIKSLKPNLSSTLAKNNSEKEDSISPYTLAKQVVSNHIAKQITNQSTRWKLVNLAPK